MDVVIPGSCGVFPGRFQPYHNGHQKVVEKYLNSHKEPLVLGIIVNAMPLEHQFSTDFGCVAAEHHAGERNPFSLWDRRRMLAAAHASNIAAGRVILLPLPRPQGPEIWWNFVKCFLPPHRFWIVPEGDEAFDNRKAEFFVDMGERVERIHEPPGSSCGREIRLMLATGKPVTGLVPDEVAAIIHEVYAKG